MDAHVSAYDSVTTTMGAMTASTKDVMATVATTLEELEALGNEKVRARNLKHGAGDDQFGVRMGDIRKVAARFKGDHQLSLALWSTGNLEARLLATLLVKPAELSTAELDDWVRAANFAQLADWVNSYVVKNHPEKETMREAWMKAADPWAARAGWSLTAGRVAREPEGLDLDGLLARIEREMPTADPVAQWTMNNTLAGIGINFPELRERAVSIGEELGVFRDYPTPKGCTSPFAPLWINEIVRRQDEAGAA